MTRSEESSKIMEQLIHEDGSKYVYTFITLAVAAIGFSVNISLELKLSVPQIPLLAAVACWGISLIYSFYAVHGKHKFYTTYRDLLDTDVEIQHKKEIYSTMVSTGLREEIEKLEKAYKDRMLNLGLAIINQDYHLNRNKVFFIFGVIFFVVWWVLKLYSN